MKRLVVGIDPGTGKSSPTGFVAFDPDERLLIHTEAITSTADDYRDRYREISDRVRELLECIDPELDTLVVCESFVMRGKGGEILARLTGALMAAVPAHQRFMFIQNTTVKKMIGGHGRAEKGTVANGVSMFFGMSFDPELNSYMQGNEGFSAEGSDISDAAAIGIAGYLRDCEAAAKRS